MVIDDILYENAVLKCMTK